MKKQEGGFVCSNESLSAICAGLDLDDSDRILSVCGSGDQPFAILEYSGKVVGVDIKNHQVKYANYRKDSLESLRVDEFLPNADVAKRFFEPYLHDLELPREYFYNVDRLENIFRKTGSLDLVDGNVFTDFDFSEFNKFYLSNVLVYHDNGCGTSRRLTTKKFFNNIPRRSLVYTVFYKPIKQDYFKDNFALNVNWRLSEVAREFSFNDVGDTWMPIVLES